MSYTKNRILNLELQNNDLKKEVQRLMLEVDILKNGRFIIDRTLDKEGDTIKWFVRERTVEYLGSSPLGTGRYEMANLSWDFDTKKECWEHIRKRRRELKKNTPYIE
jgi:hypothetical protein